MAGNQSTSRSMMEKCIVVAVASNMAIGRDNNLLWHISEDLKMFKQELQVLQKVAHRLIVLLIAIRQLALMQVPRMQLVLRFISPVRLRFLKRGKYKNLMFTIQLLMSHLMRRRAHAALQASNFFIERHTEIYPHQLVKVIPLMVGLLQQMVVRK